MENLQAFVGVVAKSVLVVAAGQTDGCRKERQETKH